MKLTNNNPDANHASCPVCRSNSTEITEIVELATVGRVWQRHFPATARLAQELPSKRIRMLVCRRCQLEWAVPSVLGGRGWYEKVSAYPQMRWEYDVTLKRLKRNSLIIELGCGPGHFLRAARRAGIEAVGFELDRTSLHEARKNGLEVFPGGLSEALALKAKNRFDSVVLVAFHVIEHIGDICELGKNISQLARTVHLSFPNPRRWTRDLLPGWRAGKHEMWNYPPWHQSRWNERSILAFAKRFKFELVIYKEEPLNRAEVTKALRQEGVLRTNDRPRDLQQKFLKLPRNRIGGRSAYVELRAVAG